MSDGVFDLDGTSATPTASVPGPMTSSQRESIRRLFAELSVADARGQLDVVAELTGSRFNAVRELDETTANVLLRTLPGKVERSRVRTTGNSWADREEDTWIDRL